MNENVLELVNRKTPPNFFFEIAETILFGMEIAALTKKLDFFNK